MTVAAHRAPNGDERLRIAITSPDILAQIRQVFAGKNLVVDIVGMPYVDVAVRPANNRDNRGRDNRDNRGNPERKPVVAGPGGPGNDSGRAPASPRPLRAEYRLSVIPVSEDRPDNVQVLAAGGRAITLSARQREVMALMSRGARNAEIAETLHVTEKTVKNHINRIFRELGVDGRVEAVLLWQRWQAEAAGRQDVRAQGQGQNAVAQ